MKDSVLTIILFILVAMCPPLAILFLLIAFLLKL